MILSNEILGEIIMDVTRHIYDDLKDLQFEYCSPGHIVKHIRQFIDFLSENPDMRLLMEKQIEEWNEYIDRKVHLSGTRISVPSK